VAGYGHKGDSEWNGSESGGRQWQVMATRETLDGMEVKVVAVSGRLWATRETLDACV
jgi:membrane-bound ClpP family serine protease